MEKIKRITEKIILVTSLFLSIVAAALIIASGCSDGQPDHGTPHEVPTYTIEQFMNNTTMWGASFSPNGEKILVSSDETGVYNAFAIPLNGGEPVQLTHSKG